MTATPYYQDDAVTLWHGDCLDVMATLPDASVDAVVTDPPYGLEFMGKGWDAPWQQSDVNADAGMSSTGYTDGGNRLERPSFTGSTNPKCLVCKGTRRGRRDGTAKVAVCLCDGGGRFPNVRAVEMRAFGEWCESWAVECLRVLKPGGHLLAFGGSRTWHRLAVAVEDAGFEIRDSIAWLYGSGFPKSLDVSKAIDKAEGIWRGRAGEVESNNGSMGGPNYERTPKGDPVTAAAAAAWQGWGTALKPAFEPIVVGRKPLVGTVAANVLAFGTGALNVDGCRVGSEERHNPSARTNGVAAPVMTTGRETTGRETTGRWPTNVILDESQAAELDRQSGVLTSGANPTSRSADKFRDAFGDFKGQAECTPARGADSGGASRFFPTFRYEAKAPTAERPRDGETAHPTVKPLDLMRWLVRLITPPGGTVLEPFAGSGTTAEACVIEGFRCVAIEREATYLPLIVQRLSKPIEMVLDLGDGAA